MRNSSLAIFLAAFASNAVAGWTAINTTATATYYVDKDTTWRSGNTVKMWSLTNYSEPQVLVKGKSVSSSAILNEYDCAEKRSRTLQAIPYKGQMREGGILFTNNSVGDWTYAPPGTVGSAELDVACSKK